MSIFESKDQMPVEPGKGVLIAVVAGPDRQFNSLNGSEVVRTMMTPNDARAIREAFWSGYSAMSTHNLPCRTLGKHY